MLGEQHVKNSVALRAQGKFLEAIAEIETNSFDDMIRVPALLQAQYAAHEMGDQEKAKEIAWKLKNFDPDIPTVKKYLPNED
jgi:uncharacterized protein HemY